MAMSAQTVARAIGIPFDGLRTVSKETRPAPETVTIPQRDIADEVAMTAGHDLKGSGNKTLCRLIVETNACRLMHLDA
jgi:hypothetical protein